MSKPWKAVAEIRSRRSSWPASVAVTLTTVIANGVAIAVNLATGGQIAPFRWSLSSPWIWLAVMLGLAVIFQCWSLGKRVVDGAAEIDQLSQLPGSVSDFTGRRSEVATLQSMITTGGGRKVSSPVAISATGLGGVGKTALALYVAHQRRNEFDGRLYVNLRGLEAPEQRRRTSDVLAQFLRSLGVDPSVVPDAEDERAALYRSRLAGKRYLILLDNAANEAQVRPLLPGSPGSIVLITSRSRLAALEGARHLHVKVMDTAVSLDLLARLASSERIKAETKEAARIVEWCGGLPLAVRICGARLASEPGLSLTQLRIRLEDERRRLGEMITGDLDVRATFAMSYHNGLSVSEQRIFRLLALITASDFANWIIAPLASVTESEADAAARRLLTLCLLEPSADDGRLRFHDLIRLYATETLGQESDHNEQREAAVRVVYAYQQFACVAVELYEPFSLRLISDRVTEIGSSLQLEVDQLRGDPGTWLAREATNMVDAVRLGYRFELWDETWRLCEAVAPLLELPSLWSEWEQINELGLRAARESEDAMAEPVMLRLAGELKIYTGHRPEAKTDLARSAELFAQLGHVGAHAAVLIRLGEAYRYLGERDTALVLMTEARMRFVELGDCLGEAYALSAIGGVQRVNGNWDSAITAFREALPVLRAFQHRRQTAIALISLGDVFHLKGAWGQALECFDECGELFRELGDTMWAANTERHAGLVDRLCGRTDKAMHRFEVALAVFEALGDKRKWALTQWALGDLYADRQDLDAAIEAYDDALAVFDGIKDQFCIANVCAHAAWSQVKQGHRVQAAKALDKARAESDKLNQPVVTAMVDLTEARYRMRNGKLLGVAEIADRGLQAIRAVGMPVWEGEALVILAEERGLQGSRQEAEYFLREALNVFSAIGVPQAKTVINALGKVRRGRWRGIRQWTT
jgi:tetratricopeptide (TPR) repeat protein